MGEDQRLGADDVAAALVEGGRDDQVDRAVLVLEQHEDDAARGLGALAGDDEAGDRDLRAVADPLELARWSRRPSRRGRRIASAWSVSVTPLVA